MTEIGKYQISMCSLSIKAKTVGEGTFGKVCLAYHTILGHEVAVKILEKKRMKDQQDIERVKREITILQLLHHPCVVQLYEIIETDTHLYLFMEYASGGELFEYIDKVKRVQEQEACRFLQQIISAIEYIHSMNVVHRDLKPENLLLTPFKDILVVDFGLSNQYTDTLLTACGSPCYAAPEMISAKPYHGLYTDLWSCGVILYAMLCGYLPFEDSNTQALYKKILTADFHIPRFVSPDAKDLLRNMLQVDPLKRFTIDKIKSHKWFQTFKSDIPKMNPFKEKYTYVPVQLQPGSQFASCVKRDQSDVFTCDTAKQSVEVLEQCVELKLQKYDIVLIKEENENDTHSHKSNSPLLVSPIIEQSNMHKTDTHNTDLLLSNNNIESVRSLTRQKSNQSLHVNEQQLIVPQPFLPEPQAPKKKVNKLAIPVMVKKPVVTRVVNKIGPSTSLHEAPRKPAMPLRQPAIPVKKPLQQPQKMQTEGSKIEVAKIEVARIEVPKQTVKKHQPTQSLSITVDQSVNSSIQWFTNRLASFSSTTHKFKSMNIPEMHKTIEQYSGPIQCSLTTTKDPKLLISGLQKYYQSKSIQSQIDHFSLHIQQTTIKVKKIAQDLYILTFTPLNMEIIQDLIQNFKL